jgi:hypothetical protein
LLALLSFYAEMCPWLQAAGRGCWAPWPTADGGGPAAGAEPDPEPEKAAEQREEEEEEQQQQHQQRQGEQQQQQQGEQQQQQEQQQGEQEQEQEQGDDGEEGGGDRVPPGTAPLWGAYAYTVERGAVARCARPAFSLHACTDERGNNYAGGSFVLSGHMELKRRKVGPEVGPTSAFYRCIAT